MSRIFKATMSEGRRLDFSPVGVDSDGKGDPLIIVTADLDRGGFFTLLS